MADDLFKNWLAERQSRITKSDLERIRTKIRDANFAHSRDNGNVFLVERFNALEAEGNVVAFRSSCKLTDN